MGAKSSKGAGQRGVNASRRRSQRNRPDESFGREYSLKEDLAIRRIFRSGKRFKGRCLSIAYYGEGSLPLKVVLKISRRNGPAPRRNRIKRIIREIIRKNKELFEQFGHLAISASISPDEESLFELIEKDLMDFAKRR